MFTSLLMYSGACRRRVIAREREKNRGARKRGITCCTNSFALKSFFINNNFSFYLI